VAQHQMPVEPVGERERLFEIDLTGPVESSRTAQSLSGHIDAEALLTTPDYREAGSVDGDAVADGHMPQAELACRNLEPERAFGPLNPADLADCRYDAAEHG